MRLKQELEAAQDSLLNVKNDLSAQLNSEYPVLTPHNFLNLEIASAFEEEQAVVETLSHQLRDLKDRLSGDLSVDERRAKLASSNAEMISSTADLRRQVESVKSRSLALRSDTAQEAAGVHRGIGL